MATKRTRKTAEQLLADYQLKIDKLQEKLDKKKTANLIKLGEAVQKFFCNDDDIDTPKKLANDFKNNLDNFIDGALSFKNGCKSSKIFNDKVSTLLNENKISQNLYDQFKKLLTDNAINNITTWITFTKKFGFDYDDSKADKIINEILNYLNPPEKTSKKKNSTTSNSSAVPTEEKKLNF